MQDAGCRMQDAGCDQLIGPPRICVEGRAGLSRTWSDRREESRIRAIVAFSCFLIEIAGRYIVETAKTPRAQSPRKGIFRVSWRRSWRPLRLRGSKAAPNQKCIQRSFAAGQFSAKAGGWISDLGSRISHLVFGVRHLFGCGCPVSAAAIRCKILCELLYALNG